MILDVLFKVNHVHKEKSGVDAESHDEARKCQTWPAFPLPEDKVAREDRLVTDTAGRHV